MASTQQQRMGHRRPLQMLRADHHHHLPPHQLKARPHLQPLLKLPDRPQIRHLLHHHHQQLHHPYHLEARKPM